VYYLNTSSVLHLTSMVDMIAKINGGHKIFWVLPNPDPCIFLLQTFLTYNYMKAICT